MLTGEPFDRFRPPLDAALEAAVAPAEGYPPRLADAMRYSLLAGGKRLRPLLTLAACKLVGGDFTDALPAAVAVEMVHTYSLIHDDLPAMDDDDLRRGRPTSHRQFDEATAILAGDALLTEAFAQLRGLPPGTRGDCMGLLAEAAGPRGMVGGQMDDMLAETQPGTSVDQLEAIHARKTGALITASLAMGSRCGDAGEPEMTAITRYGQRLGLLFQLTDDLLDATGDAAAMGKAAGKDAGRGKATFPGLIGLAETRRAAERLATEAVDSLAPFGDAAAPLAAIARSLITRDR